MVFEGVPSCAKAKLGAIAKPMTAVVKETRDLYCFFILIIPPGIRAGLPFFRPLQS
jgi:hypothetical protein